MDTPQIEGSQSQWQTLAWKPRLKDLSAIQAAWQLHGRPKKQKQNSGPAEFCIEREKFKMKIT